MDLSLSVASSSKSKTWKNQSISWADFKKRLQEPTVTQETVAEYTKMTTAQKSDVKDVGGFVAGHLAHGQRKKGHVVQRSMITLDADSPRPDLWEDFLMMYDCTALLYSTHSHKPGKPRYRIIIPLARPVTPDEYVPIALKIADNLGLDNFDDTTYQPERLMFWASHSRDAEYIFESNDAEFLDPDSVLAEYPDWSDISYWPELPKAKKLMAREVKKAGEPTEKPGIIGVFCRQYSITEAIAEFIPEVYTLTDHDDRFTYAEGSTSGGLVIYDDKFAYSHHSTDPAGDQLVNAWDMVRLHKFVELDDDAKAGTPVSRLPSMKAMKEFAGKLTKIKTELQDIALGEAVDEFSDELEEVTTEEIPKDYFEIDGNGNVKVNHFLLAKYIAKVIPLWFFDSDSEELFRYYDKTRGIWRGAAKTFLKSYITKLLLGLTSTKNRNETLADLQDLSFKTHTFPEAPPEKIVLANGVFDLKTSNFTEGFDPELHTISSHPINYDPDADCPVFDGYLETVVGKENMATIYEWMGYLFYGQYKLQNVLFLYGGGGTGKSTLISLMQAIVGRQSTSAVSLEALVKNDFAVAGLVGKTANFDADAKPEYLADAGLFKKLSGEDETFANPKGKPGYGFKNKAKLTFSMNKLPRMTDTSGGMARRVIIIKMDKVVTSAVKRQYPLKAMKQELPGIFNKVTKYFNEALSRGYFSVSESAQKERDNWLELNDPIGEFIREATEIGDDYAVKSAELYRAYAEWAKLYGMNPSNARNFNDRLKEMGYEKQQVKTLRTKGFKGVKLKGDFLGEF